MMNRRYLWISLVCFALLAVFSFAFNVNVSQAQEYYGFSWSATYYNDNNLGGTPIAGGTISQVNFTWPGSPFAGVNPDNFSAQFTTTDSSTPGGTYEFVATADDRVRVFVNGVSVIDQWDGGTPGTTYVGTVTISGTITVRVDFREFTDNASVRVFWRPLGSTSGTGATATPIGPTPTVGPTLTPTATALPAIPAGALTATVIRASALVVRDAPFLGANRIDTIRRGQTYQVLGRNEDATWFLLQLAGKQGWSFGYYLFINGNEFSAPIVNPYTTFAQPASDTGVVIQSNAVLKLRAEPNAGSTQIGRVDWGALLPVTARSARGSWYQVVWKGTVGWVYSPYTTVIVGDITTVPSSGG